MAKILFLILIAPMALLQAADRSITIGKAPPKPESVALIIGNGDYQTVSPLGNPTNDAKDISRALTACGFETILVEDGLKNDIDQAIFRFSRRLEEAKVGLFYYAGHAVQVDGLNYLIPVDASIEKKYQLKSQCVLIDDVLGAMEEAKNPTNIIILDACRNNPFKSATRAASRGLARMNSPKGSLLVYATSPGDVAKDGDGRNGVFTTAFLKHVLTPGLEVSGLLRKVRGEVLSSTEEGQMPWESSYLVGEYYFVPDGSSTPPALETFAAPPPEPTTWEPGNSISEGQLDLAFLPSSTFSMGSASMNIDERPQHNVMLSQGLWMGTTEVTQSLYTEIIGKNPSTFKGENLPVETVTWNEANSFCKKLTEKYAERLPEGYAFRLPTEAEWEYGTSKGAGHTWHRGNAGRKTQPVGSKEKNGFGLADMTGNVWEWTLDAYDSNAYSRSERKDPWVKEGRRRVVRGGSWNDLQRFCRPTNRDHHEADIKGDILGFRIVLAPTLP